MSGRDELVMLMALRAREVTPGRYALTRKFIDGVDAFARRWPGRLTVLAELSEASSDDLDPVVIDRSQPGPFAFEPAPEDVSALRSRLAGAACVLASLHYTELAEACGRAGVPLVYVAEHSIRTHAQMMKASVPNPLVRLRRGVWLRGYERRRREAVRRAAGLQCNGAPSFEAYASLSPDAMIFFDSRTTLGMTASDEQAERRLATLRSGAPLRLVFSGRLVRIKGVDHLPLVARELDRLGVAFTMDIFGSGDRSDALAARVRGLGLDDRVRLRGAVDFATQLAPAVTAGADLFVCCHPQGDPSCTYLETMACAAPIAGYANDAWRGLHERTNVGWVTRLGDPVALARTIAGLDRDRASLERAALASLAFAREHAFEQTMDRRAAHLRRIAGLEPPRTDARPASPLEAVRL